MQAVETAQLLHQTHRHFGWWQLYSLNLRSSWTSVLGAPFWKATHSRLNLTQGREVENMDHTSRMAHARHMAWNIRWSRYQLGWKGTCFKRKKSKWKSVLVSVTCDWRRPLENKNIQVWYKLKDILVQSSKHLWWNSWDMDPMWLKCVGATMTKCWWRLEGRTKQF